MMLRGWCGLVLLARPTDTKIWPPTKKRNQLFGWRAAFSGVRLLPTYCLWKLVKNTIYVANKVTEENHENKKWTRYCLRKPSGPHLCGRISYCWEFIIPVLHERYLHVANSAQTSRTLRITSKALLVLVVWVVKSWSHCIFPQLAQRAALLDVA